MNTRSPQILVVEDEAHIASGLKLNLELEGFSVTCVTTAREAFQVLVAKSPWDAIVLDVMLPDMNGFELCRRMRHAGNFTPVLMLTARSEAEDRVLGLDAGADDYLVKPFELNELLARLRSMLRRRQWESSKEDHSQTWFRFGNSEVNFATHEVTVAGAPTKLTQLELDLLRYFVSNAGRVLTREELLEQVWKLRNYPNTRTVDNFIVRLRRLFEPNPRKPVHFVAHRGSGYKFIQNP